MNISKLKEVATATVKENPHLRYGQCLFNYLYESNPELADEIRGSDIDPFYSVEGDSRIQGFLKKIEEAK